jgi:outer membrane protein assembly factor BamE (lipoprotein component of BamABCDE complex)
MKILMSLLLILGLASCAHGPSPTNFVKLKNGMPKYEVLELIGHPKFVERVQGQDHWQYKFATESGIIERSVHFENGKVVYSGK